MITFRQIFVATILSGLLCAEAIAQTADSGGVFVEIPPEKRIKYRRAKFLSGVYRDTKIADGKWKVSSTFGADYYHWLTDKVVLRRASELAIAYGKPFVHVVIKKAERQMYGMGLSNADLVIEATAVDEKDAEAHCEKRISVFGCKTFSAETAMVETLPYIILPTEK